MQAQGAVAAGVEPGAGAEEARAVAEAMALWKRHRVLQANNGAAPPLRLQIPSFFRFPPPTPLLPPSALRSPSLHSLPPHSLHLAIPPAFLPFSPLASCPPPAPLLLPLTVFSGTSTAASGRPAKRGRLAGGKAAAAAGEAEGSPEGANDGAPCKAAAPAKHKARRARFTAMHGDHKS